MLAGAAAWLAPRCRPLDRIERVEGGGEESPEAEDRPIDPCMELGASRLILPVINFVAHDFSLSDEWFRFDDDAEVSLRCQADGAGEAVGENIEISSERTIRQSND